VYSFFGVLTLLGSFTLIFQGQILTIGPVVPLEWMELSSGLLQKGTV